MTLEPVTQERHDLDAPDTVGALSPLDRSSARLRAGLTRARASVGPATSAASERTARLVSGMHTRTGPVVAGAAVHLRESGRSVRQSVRPAARRSRRAATDVYTTYRARKRAVPLGQEEVVKRQARGDRRGEAVKLNELGSAYRKRREFAEAVVCYAQALATFQDLRNRRGEGLSLSNLGLAYDDQGNTVKAARCFEDALAIFRELGDTQIQGQILANLGTTYRRQGHRHRATETWAEALALLNDGTPAHTYLSKRLGAPA